jgi:hypothetical protein
VHDIDNDYLTKGHNPRVDYSMLDQWHLCQVNFSAVNGDKMFSWLEAAPGERYYWTRSGNIWFEREEDMILFQLTWC